MPVKYSISTSNLRENKTENWNNSTKTVKNKKQRTDLKRRNYILPQGKGAEIILTPK